MEKINGKIEAISPVHVGDEKQSNISTHTKLEVSGREAIPYIPGNSIRGVLRRMITDDFMNLLGVTSQTEKDYYFHFVGGALSESGDKTNLEFKRRCVNLLPHISMFGTAYGSETIQGKLLVSHAIPEDPDCIQFFQMTRRDDLKVRTDEQAPLERDSDEKEQMIFNIECIKCKTILNHAFYIRAGSVLDKATLGRTLKLWKENPFLGGLAARGFGEVGLDYPDIPDEEYLLHIEKNKEDILELIDKIRGL